MSNVRYEVFGYIIEKRSDVQCNSDFWKVTRTQASGKFEVLNEWCFDEVDALDLIRKDMSPTGASGVVEKYYDCSNNYQYPYYNKDKYGTIYPLYNKGKGGYVIPSKKDDDKDYHGYGEGVQIVKVADTEAKLEKKFRDSQIEIPLNVYRKLFYYVKATDSEISGLGAVELKKSGGKERYVIKDVFLFKQKSTGGGTVLNKPAMAKFQVEYIKKGGDPGELRCWFHSHANMGTFWSMTDDECCNGFDSDSWMISIVANHSNSIRGRLDLYKPKRVHDRNLKVVCEIGDEDKLRIACEKEVKEKNLTTNWGYAGNGYYGY